MANDKIKKAKRINALRFLFIGLLGRKNINLRALGYFLLLIIAIAWIPDGLFQILDSLMDLILKGCLKILELLTSFFNMLLEHKEIPTAGIFTLIISLGLLWYLYRQIESYVSPGKIQVEQKSAPVSKVLILFLSSLQKKPETIITDAIKTKDNLDELMEIFQKERISWEMPLISIKHHLSKLKKIIVFTSCSTENSKGSEEDYELFENMIKKFYADKSFANSISKLRNQLILKMSRKFLSKLIKYMLNLKKKIIKKEILSLILPADRSPIVLREH